MNMKNTIYSFMLLLILSTSLKEKNEWEPLLDKGLDKWETYLSFSHVNGYKGDAPVDGAGIKIEPIGYNKAGQQVFTMTEETGEPVLKVSGEIYGCVYTKQEFDNYHLKLKIKWGSNKFEPRISKLKDSGILYHSIGESGVDYWRSWMLSQEFQIMEGHMGDYWSIANSAIDIRAYLSEGKMNSIANIGQSFLKFGKDGQEGFCMRSENHETPGNGWTTLELICFEDKSLHIVNGQVVMVLKNSRYVVDGKAVPLTKGKIQLQSEGAEVYFKDIQIKKLNRMPEEYTVLFQENILKGL